MKSTLNRPSKEEQIIAMDSYEILESAIDGLKEKNPEIEIEETKEKIKIPLSALKLLADILKAMSKGNPISIMPLASELTTQAAAEYLGYSRPHLVKLLESEQIPYTKIGKHRRIRFDDIVDYKKKIRNERKNLLIEMIQDDEELGLYDT
ncbi:MAG: excisionase family DNA-binding protein [Cytophagales bacterium]|nr:excisionase family DNA-binding protein [Cytophagales bacterium]